MLQNCWTMWHQVEAQRPEPEGNKKREIEGKNSVRLHWMRSVKRVVMLRLWKGLSSHDTCFCGVDGQLSWVSDVGYSLYQLVCSTESLERSMYQFQLFTHTVMKSLWCDHSDVVICLWKHILRCTSRNSSSRWTLARFTWDVTEWSSWCCVQ